jgi:hypothetical protein
MEERRKYQGFLKVFHNVEMAESKYGIEYIDAMRWNGWKDRREKPIVPVMRDSPVSHDRRPLPAPAISIPPMAAIYSVYTSPTHPPIPNHLPTLIVTPHGDFPLLHLPSPHSSPLFRSIHQYPLLLSAHKLCAYPSYPLLPSCSPFPRRTRRITS